MQTINAATEITTAARRITRALNKRPAEVTLAFDADGHEVGGWSTGMWHVNPSDVPGILHRSGGKNRANRYTFRMAQDWLDAIASGDPDEYYARLEMTRASHA